jgi:type VI secretion system protein ImpJ
LSVDRLQCTALALRLPDGTLIDSETAATRSAQS